MDQRFFAFIGVKSAAFKKQVATGKGDGAVYQWIIKQIVPRLSHTDILAWSQFQEQRTPGDLDSREFFHGLHQKAAPHREDIHTWFDLLDIDDYVSFGGNA
jgi:hypothetical protein